MVVALSLRNQEHYQREAVSEEWLTVPPFWNFYTRKRIRRIVGVRAINDPLALLTFSPRMAHRSSSAGSWYRFISTADGTLLVRPMEIHGTGMFLRNGRSFSGIEPERLSARSHIRLWEDAPLELACIRARGIINRGPLAWLHGF